jgi:phospholipase C
VNTVLGPPGSPSSYYNDTLVLVTWDEGGGYWDHVSPPADSAVDNVAGYGAAVPYGDRVPLLAIGRFAKVGYVSHVRTEHASIVNFVEWNWLNGVTGQLDALVSAAGPTSHARDAYANNIGDLLDPLRTGVTVPRTP